MSLLHPRRARGALPLLLLSIPALPGAGQEPPLTLNDAVDAALATHPALGAAEARAEAAAHTGSAARAGRLPGISLEGTLTRFQEPMVVAPLHSLDLTRPPVFDETLLQGRLAMAYTLFDGGARGARIQAADALAEGSAATRDEARSSLIESVVDAFAQVLAARAVSEAADALVGALEEEADRARQAYDAGTAAEVELARAGAALEDARARRVAARAGAQVAERALARLMGLPPDALEGRDLAEVAAPAPPEASPGSDAEPHPDAYDDGAPATPAEVRALQAVAAAEARVSQERAAFAPRLDVGAALLDFGTATGNHTQEWQAGAQVSWPVFTGGARQASLRRARAELTAARRELDRVRLELAGARDAASARLREAHARVRALRASVARWEDVVRIESLALDVGSGTQSDFLRAQASLFQSRAGLVQARYDAVRAAASLARLRGRLDGDWIRQLVEMDR